MAIDVNNEFIDFVAQSSTINTIAEERLNGNHVTELGKKYKGRYKSTIIEPTLKVIKEKYMDNEYHMSLKDDEIMYKDASDVSDAIKMMQYCELFLRPLCLPPIDLEAELDKMTESIECVPLLARHTNDIISVDDRKFMANTTRSREDNSREEGLKNDFLIGTSFQDFSKKDTRAKYISDDKTKMILRKEDNMGVQYVYYEFDGDKTHRVILKKPGYIRDRLVTRRYGFSPDIIIDRERKSNGNIFIYTTDPYFIRLCDDKYNAVRKQSFIRKAEEYISTCFIKDGKIEVPAKNINTKKRGHRHMHITFEKDLETERIIGRKYIYSINNTKPLTNCLPKAPLLMFPFWMKYFIIKGGELYGLQDNE